MLSRANLHFLSTPVGCELLADAAAADGDLLARLMHLRRRWSSDLASAAIELLDLRSRARAKFSRASEMFFTREGLEQSSSEVISRWRAGRFPQVSGIVDLCCGIGGDAIALAKKGKVLAVDRDPAAAWCARHNAAIYRVPVEAACADVTRLRLNAGCGFWDPSRRRNGRRVRTGEEYSPPLSYLTELRREVPNLAAKVSPALPDEEIDALIADGARIEFVSEAGECKEAVIWFGDIGPPASKSATVLPTGDSLSHIPGRPAPEVRDPGAWLLEPDPAVIRAHLLAEVCEEMGAWLLDAQTAYLSANVPPASPYVRAYRIVEWMPFNLARLKSRLRRLDRTVAVVKRRAVPMEPEEIRRKLTVPGGEPATLVLGRIQGRPAAIVCEMLDSDRQAGRQHE